MNIKRRQTTDTQTKKIFCQYYVDIEGNASEAYRMAYNASKNEGRKCMD